MPTRTTKQRRRGRSVLPTTMRAAAIDRVGPASALTIHELPLPKVGAHDVLIAVDTAGVGSWEPSMRAGEWGVEDARFPLVLGMDGSGTVVARGARVRRFNVGDKVYAYEFAAERGGFDAEYVAVREPHVARIPDGLDLLHAGASPAIALTAVQGIDDALHIKSGDCVVIVGASGNVGMFAVQFAKARGARVLAIASGRDGVEFACRLGADIAVDGKRANLRDVLDEFAPDGVDAVLGLAGGKVLTTCINAVRTGGRVAYPNGVEPAPRKRRGIKFTSYDAKMRQRDFDHLNRTIGETVVEVPIAKEFPLEKAADAHRRVEKGHVLGRVVLRVRKRSSGSR